MNFLNPWYLLAALAAAVPLIIHLLHRQRARIEVFPSLEFLRKMMRKRTRRFRLKQLLLLVTRTLLLLCLALALARPTLTGGRAGRGHLPTTAVVILDDSFSMMRQGDGGNLFDLARSKTEEVLKYFSQGDEVHLLTASSPSRDLSQAWATRDASRLHDRIGELSCSDTPTDFASPLEAAATLLAKSTNPEKEIYIISDMQKVGWDGVQGVVGDEKSAAKALLVSLGESDANNCVEDVGFRIPSGSDDLEMDVTFTRFNSSEGQGRVAEVFLAGSLLGRAVFAPGDAAREKETFRLPPSQGFEWGEVALAEDRLKIDDKRYFAVPSRRRVVGVVGDAYYISKALSPEGGGNFTVVGMDEGAITRESLSRLDVLVISNVARLAPLEIDAIVGYLGGGGSLLVSMGSNVDIGDYNRNLLPRISGGEAGAGTDSAAVGAEAGGVRIEGLVRGSAGGEEQGFYSVDRYDRGHRIFSKFKADTNPFADARFYTFMKIRPGRGHVVAYFTDGSPAIIEVGDRVMVFAGSADVAWSDFVLTPQFLPIIHEALLYLSSRARLSQAYNVGEEITVRTGTRSGEAFLQGPTGSQRLFPEAMGEGMGYRIASPGQPGVYFLTSAGETLSVFAVNVDTRESDLTTAAPEEIASKLKHFSVKQVAAPEDVGESISLLRKGRDLSRAFLWAGLILFLFETVLASNLSFRFARTDGQDALPDS
jgi:hypothetical protein